MKHFKLACICHFLLCMCGIPWLNAQPNLEGSAQRLRSNVISISVLPSNDATYRNGFGFITGVNKNTVYAVTAAHNIYGNEFQSLPNEPKQIEVKFYLGPKVKAVCVKYWKNDDLALLEIQTPTAIKWQPKSLGIKTKIKQEITFIGRNQEWQIPAEGYITQIDQYIINADNSYLEPGSSGAPLLNKMGIIGMIVRDDVQRCEALSLSRVNMLLRSEGPDYYQLEPSTELYNASPLNVIVQGGTGMSQVAVPANGIFPFTRALWTNPGLWGSLELMITRNIGVGISYEQNKCNKGFTDAFITNYHNIHFLSSTYGKVFVTLNQMIVPGRLDFFARGVYCKSFHNYELSAYEQEIDLIIVDNVNSQKFEVENNDWRGSLGARYIISKNLGLTMSYERGQLKGELDNRILEKEIIYHQQFYLALQVKF